MALDLNSTLFIHARDVVLRARPEEKTHRNALNHLIMGDFASYAGEREGSWIKIRSRGNTGWVPEESLTNKRMLEVNFVDIGQGDGCHIVTPDDQVILIDAGEGIGFSRDGGDNMNRFITWRYNLRNRKVAGVEDVTENDPEAKPRVEIDHVIISHPDLDHYYGFYTIFQNHKMTFKRIYHNGIVERPFNGVDKKTWYYDLGRKQPVNPGSRTYHLIDTVRTNSDMHDLIDANSETGKRYLQTLVAAKNNTKSIEFDFLHKEDLSREVYLKGFEKRKDLSIEILSPLTEPAIVDGTEQQCLITLGGEGKTKNGHSITLKMTYGKLTMMIGGDLNSNSQDYLSQKYSGIETKMSDLEDDIKKITEKLSADKTLSLDKRHDLEHEREEKKQLLDLIVTRVRKHFRCDVAKACHHGSSHVLDSFLATIHPIATIISSGDQESHSHPRPDALGAFGKNSRGQRPLIFSTELARSSYEFSYPFKFYELLKKIEARIAEVETQKEKDRLRRRMERLRDSNVAKYGMITVRSDGERVIIAQKLEKPRSLRAQWDIYDLVWNPKLGEFEYIP